MKALCQHFAELLPCEECRAEEDRARQALRRYLPEGSLTHERKFFRLSWTSHGGEQEIFGSATSLHNLLLAGYTHEYIPEWVRSITTNGSDFKIENISEEQMFSYLCGCGGTIVYGR